MESNEIKNAVEAVLFAVGEAVQRDALAAVLDVGEDEIESAALSLKKEYDDENRGIALIELDGGYQLCSRSLYYPYIQDILGVKGNQALSNAAMETLAVIAYRQPVTRAQIEYVRGVNSDGCVNRLYERGLIDECGRLDAPGRPILYKTTQTFLRCFGLKSADELPPLDFSKKDAELLSDAIAGNGDEGDA